MEGSLERVVCGQSSDPSGPSHAVFLLYATPNDVTRNFAHGAGVAGYSVASSCPGDQASPGTWGDSYRDQTAGLVECGTSAAGKPAVIWTDDDIRRLGIVEGNDIDTLYRWWRGNA
ncbi:hypothetical protein MBOU_54000 [Mycobacterium bourgelatii]|uniref:Serine/threonine protein kinase n=1 Tax=Mycobacterium bourgelatii TaxID=1273442 RepID=A0A7I9YXL6_MYCBU|nr:hypothetical protein MBOU_54000 [Mycobacterium bourgelatii]